MTDPAAGLASAEAREALVRVGRNDLAPLRRLQALRDVVHLLNSQRAARRLRDRVAQTATVVEVVKRHFARRYGG